MLPCPAPAVSAEVYELDPADQREHAAIVSRLADWEPCLPVCAPQAWLLYRPLVPLFHLPCPPTQQVKEFLNATHWPKHLLVHFTWRVEHEEDEARGLLLLFAATAAVALALGANVARTYQDKLAAFLSDVAGGDSVSGAYSVSGAMEKGE